MAHSRQLLIRTDLGLRTTLQHITPSYNTDFSVNMEQDVPQHSPSHCRLRRPFNSSTPQGCFMAGIDSSPFFYGDLKFESAALITRLSAWRSYGPSGWTILWTILIPAICKSIFLWRIDSSQLFLEFCKTRATVGMSSSCSFRGPRWDGQDIVCTANRFVSRLGLGFWEQITLWGTSVANVFGQGIYNLHQFTSIYYDAMAPSTRFCPRSISPFQNPWSTGRPTGLRRRHTQRV